ncbi:MAG: Holliday junction resolvase RecU [Lachnospiraceae bacterium]|nr:Holliday junction resolvase RecU [Lachnospiraceae bacterium]
MAVWNSRGLRGSVLEDIINITIEKLRQQGLALIQKIPTPITPIEIDKASRHITLAYFDKKSTVDYIGVVQGVPVCFDAKECASDTFALQNVHEHQVEFMRDFERQEGIAFLVIYFSHIDKYYYMRFSELDTFWKRQQEGGRKSFRRDELDERYYIGELKNNILPFLNRLQDDMDER